MTPEKIKESLSGPQKQERRRQFFEEAKKDLPKGIVIGTGLAFGLFFTFKFLKRFADRGMRPEIEKITQNALSEIEEKTSQLGKEMAALVVIQEEVAPDLQALARKRGGGKIINALRKICALSGIQPGARRLEDLILVASIKALEGVENLLKETPNQDTSTTQSQPQDN